MNKREFDIIFNIKDDFSISGIEFDGRGAMRGQKKFS